MFEIGEEIECLSGCIYRVSGIVLVKITWVIRL